MASPSPSPITPENCAAELMETIHPIMQFIRTEMRSQREPSLSVPQFRLLRFLSRHPASSLSEVAEHLGVTRATASAMTDRLVKRGLVDRAEDPQERRQVMLKLTGTGQKQLDQMRNMTRLKISELMGGLTSEELASVSKGLKILGNLFEEPSDKN
ncbi:MULTISPECIES: MarR family transcriptional regulator [unclassified Leptolyngbya]|uniref:MarR family winged helix-turn-helix transcriptional regulator n=1 Tax=unclassified Leptolyngbya TaxID=2650499 RepID=UPI0016832100|nr:MULTISPECIES: MarR family transcriptional regulator [unclassified Leptolyngbya]MBD1911116.1 MarR family transcriptional regulator [Leptolyngbya sp. FACHB-8]MBD2153978.1 MarR family transcriptional regulator [Leptolyngbya sp. FACHB-16]